MTKIEGIVEALEFIAHNWTCERGVWTGDVDDVVGALRHGCATEDDIRALLAAANACEWSAGVLFEGNFKKGELKSVIVRLCG